MGGINSKSSSPGSRSPRKKKQVPNAPLSDGRSVTLESGQAILPPVPKTILIIEDDQTTQHIIRHFLEKDGFIVASAGDAEEGLQQARNKPPSLILLDLMLPGMSGFQVLSHLKQDAALAPIPVFIISSLIQEDNIMKALTSGAVDYITKPFSPLVLVAKIKLLLTGRL